MGFNHKQRVTIIIYQHPVAAPDVYRWAADLKVVLTPLPASICYTKYPSYRVLRNDETIYLIADGDIDKLDSFEDFAARNETNSKLVLWGQFTTEDLGKLHAFMVNRDMDNLTKEPHKQRRRKNG